MGVSPPLIYGDTMANANIRIRVWIDRILEDGEMETSKIFESMQDLRNERGRRYRNLPTMNQLTNVLAKGPNYVSKKGHKNMIWELKDNAFEG
tara:strand:- start:2797 stop:3075 length:279 start_codon:yes stop_codon:yes gene_type:complete